MSKKRGQSPLTGVRKISTDAVEAATIRKVLAKHMHAISLKIGDDAKHIHMPSSPGLKYVHAGREAHIVPKQVETFGLELVSKDILRDVKRNDGDGYFFLPTKQGWSLIRRANNRLSETPRTTFTTDLATRQKTIVRDKVSATTLRSEQRSGPSLKYQNAPPPRSRELLLPLLRIAAQGTIHRSSVMNFLARNLGFPQKKVDVAFPPNTNQTFSLNAHHAIRYLVRNRLLTQTKKHLKITSEGTLALASKPTSWKDFQEPVIKQIDAQSGAVTSRGPKIDVARVLAGLREMEPIDLIGVWNNAHRILLDLNRRDQHEKATEAIKGIEAEWKRRNTSGDPSEYFDWPTTEAKSGDGSLSLDQIQKTGVLGQLDYHVGKTNGAPDLARRRTLSKIFELPLPDTLRGFSPSEWGPPGSAARLRKMAYSITSFTRSAKRKSAIKFEVAISQWESDLKFLHDQYYLAKFGFQWPTTNVT